MYPSQHCHLDLKHYSAGVYGRCIVAVELHELKSSSVVV